MKRHSVLFLLLAVPILCLAQAEPQQPSAPAQQPSAQSQPNADANPAADPNDPLFGVPPIPKGRVSLVGGTVTKIDRVREKVSVKIFGGGGKMDFKWDERTHIFRDGVETTERGIQKGDRVYVDSMRDGSYLFARNIRVVTKLEPTDARGQLLSYNPATGMIELRDNLSGRPVWFRVTDKTMYKSREGSASRLDLVPGSLLAVHFVPGKEHRGVAREVSVIAKPGSSFQFAGKVTNLDMRSGLLSMANQTDNKTYDIGFDTSLPVASKLQVGSVVTVNADFTGHGYRARDITVNQ